ncbi:hypothetical protein IDH12_00385 [Pelagibacterales bacterium SAG-MED29]|nr:hypothetical protein [Pelagibacterales bacterium SAG-MED29]
MKKLITILFFTLYMGASHAEFNFGVSGALTQIDASGSEIEGGETNTKSVSNVVVIPSLFAEFGVTDRITIGVDYVPMTADVSDKTYTRNDIETSVTDTATTSSTSRSQKASAELSDHMTVYADVMINDEVFVKFGGVQVELETKDSLGTGSKYGDETVNGYLIGVGTKKDVDFFGKFIKLEVIYTDYDDISITSSVARTGVTTNNKITADLDTTQFKVSYAF